MKNYPNCDNGKTLKDKRSFTFKHTRAVNYEQRNAYCNEKVYKGSRSNFSIGW